MRLEDMPSIVPLSERHSKAVSALRSMPFREPVGCAARDSLKLKSAPHGLKEFVTRANA